jgi:hypothetical protein
MPSLSKVLLSKGMALRGLVLMLLAAVCLSVCGCKNPQSVWTAESKSPDGKMVATAQAYANGGFGVSGSPATFVYLNWATGSQKPKEILELSNESDTPEGESVGIKWVSPSRLELTYHKGKQEIEFQAVRFLNVDIGVTDLSASSADSR